MQIIYAGFHDLKLLLLFNNYHLFAKSYMAASIPILNE